MPRELIYKDEAYSAVLHDNPASAYCINRIKPVDAVEVVRCKECEHYNNKDVNLLPHCKLSGITKFEDDFCSDGERREGE